MNASMNILCDDLEDIIDQKRLSNCGAPRLMPLSAPDTGERRNS